MHVRVNLVNVQCVSLIKVSKLNASNNYNFDRL